VFPDGSMRALTRSRYLILDILGQGTFGQVVKCQNMKTHEVVAVKVVKNKPAYFNQSMMEVTILELVCTVSLSLSLSLSLDVLSTHLFAAEQDL
jgi:serine/threonine protein kinase